MTGSARDRATLDPWKPWNFFAEEERSADGALLAVNALFLTNRECPWRCVMCDLWKNTLDQDTPAGAIPRQIEHALGLLPPATVVKLYNSGSFFDPRAIPVEDYATIAQQLTRFDRVIVESHPSLIGESCFRFRSLIRGRLEVAMGLETVHPEALRRLGKGMTLDQFSAAAASLGENGIDLRVFILVKPPFLSSEPEAVYWGQRSLEFAFSCGATAASLIPTRGGNPALDELAARGEFTPPRIETLEACQEYGLGLRQGRVFADLWDLDKFFRCEGCRQARYRRLREMNLTQTIPPQVDCAACGVRE
jgi:radical SAM enzyme (TIGR01210 family)